MKKFALPVHRLKPNLIRARGQGASRALIVMALLVAVGGYLVVRSSHAATLVGDLNSDGQVNVFDLSILLSEWGTSNATADLNHDGTVNVFDLSILLSNWGNNASPSPAPTSTPTTSWNCLGAAAYACDYPADIANFVGMDVNKWNDPLGNNVSTNEWSPVSGETMSLSANSVQNYQITANANNPGGSVTAYPNASPAHGPGLGPDYNGIVDDYTALTENISQTMPINSNTSAWAMDDDRFSDPGHGEDNYDYELMIQYDFTNNGACSAAVNNININGTLWHLCNFEGPRPGGVCSSCGAVAFKLGATEADKPSTPSTSMTIDIKAMVTWLETHQVAGQTYNYFNPGVSISGLSTGWEIANTGGTTENFDGKGYSINAQGGCAAGVRADCNLN